MSKSPKIVCLDIETSPITGYTWQTYDANVLKIIEPSKIISVAWKELHSKDVNCKSISDYKSYQKGVVDDNDLVKEIWDVLDRADIIIAHHGDSFDLKKLNYRFVVNGLSAPSSYETVDTLKIAKKYFKFDSNSLDNLGEVLGEGKKINNGGFSLWTRCMAGDAKAWEAMKAYNIQDVLLLERVYLRLRPFQDNHPDLNLLTSNIPVENCNTCLSTNIIKRGFSFTRTGRKQRYQCQDCSSWSLGSFQRVKEPASDVD